MTKTKLKKSQSNKRRSVVNKKTVLKKKSALRRGSIRQKQASKKIAPKKRVILVSKPSNKALRRKVSGGRVSKKSTVASPGYTFVKNRQGKSEHINQATTKKNRVTTKKPASLKVRTISRSTKGKSKRPSITSHIKIKIIGVGGGGGNAITRMRKSFSVRGVEFIAINTDIQDLDACYSSKKLNIGRALTKGMGAGMNPEIGQQAAEENRSEIEEVLKGADIIFLTAGFGGGTGTGAGPVIAQIAKEMGILTVAIITKPFSFEGTARAKIAEEGIAKIKDRVDTLLIVPNDRIFSIIDKNTSVLKAFEKIDEILQSAVQGVAEIVSSSGLVNVDFADIKAVMSEVGLAVIGVGVATGSDRAIKAVGQATHSPLLDISIEGARSVLFGISGRNDLKMTEINEAAKIITDSVDPGAKIIFGAYNDRKLRAGELKVVLIAAGFNGMALKHGDSSPTLFSNDFNDTPLGTKRATLDKNDTGPRSEIKTPTLNSIPEDEDVWDVPTFIRKKGKKS